MDLRQTVNLRKCSYFLRPSATISLSEYGWSSLHSVATHSIVTPIEHPNHSRKCPIPDRIALQCYLFWPSTKMHSSRTIQTRAHILTQPIPPSRINLFALLSWTRTESLCQALGSLRINNSVDDDELNFLNYKWVRIPRFPPYSTWLDSAYPPNRTPSWGSAPFHNGICPERSFS